MEGRWVSSLDATRREKLDTGASCPALWVGAKGTLVRCTADPRARRLRFEALPLKNAPCGAGGRSPLPAGSLTAAPIAEPLLLWAQSTAPRCQAVGMFTCCPPAAT